MRAIVGCAMSMFARSPAQGALEVLWASLLPTIDPSKPFIRDCVPKGLPPICDDDAKRREVYDRMCSDAGIESPLI